MGFWGLLWLWVVCGSDGEFGCCGSCGGFGGMKQVVGLDVVG